MKRFAVAVLVVCACLALSGCGAAVPDVTGKTVSQATGAIVAAGFQVGALSYDETAVGADGSVVSQTVQSGSTVSLTIAGPPPVPTPTLLRLDRAKAESALIEVGLALGAVTEAYDASTTAGMVASQTPAPGVDDARGSGVAIVISKGPEPIAVPSVVGKTKAEATALLLTVGFKVKSTNKDNAAKKGIVVAQKPPNGVGQPGTTVILTVSTGVTYVTVPDMWKYVRQYPGLDETTHNSAIEAFVNKRIAALGLRLRIRDVPDTKPNGWPQEPRAGTRVRRGTVVVLPIIS